MQLFAPNVLVVGDTIFDLNDATGKPNPKAAAQKYETDIMALRQKIQAQPFGARWLEIMSGGVSGEVLLIHELTHAYRSASGRFSPVPMTNLVNPDSLRRSPDLARRFPDWEEWFAIVVENVFAAEAGKKIMLRTSWDILLPSFADDPGYFKFWNIPTTGTRNDSQQFAHDYRPAIARILQVEPRLFRAMESSRAWFNPVRDHVAELLSSRL